MSAINTVMASFLIFEIPVSYHEVVFVDDADKRGVKFEPSFFFSINTILEFLPKQRRTGLFSATQTQEVESLVRAGLRNPVRISVKEKGVAASSTQKTPSRLENYYMVRTDILTDPVVWS